MQGGDEVWSDGKGAFAYFTNGRLSHIDQGRLPKQRINIRTN